MTNTPTDEIVTEDQVLKFLNGEGPLGDLWWGDKLRDEIYRATEGTVYGPQLDAAVNGALKAIGGGLVERLRREATYQQRSDNREYGLSELLDEAADTIEGEQS